MRHRRVTLIGVVVLALTMGPGVPALGAPGAGTLTVRVIGGATKTSLRLQPGFATVIRADHRIDTVAIGDPRLVTATTVKRGQDVYDLVLQPQLASGATNMVVWFGDLTSIWVLVIGPGQRTADIVYVVTAVGAAPSPGSAAQSPTSPSVAYAPVVSASIPSTSGDSGSEHGAGPAQVSAPRAFSSAAGASPHAEARSGAIPSFPPTAPPFLEARQTVGGAVAVFRVLRARNGVIIRYRITNNGGDDLAIRLSGVLVRVNGRLVPFGMARDSVDRGRLAILPRGATETGVIDAPGRAARQVEVIFSLFPVNGDKQGPGGIIPLTFQPMFAGVDRLATAIAP